MPALTPSQWQLSNISTCSGRGTPTKPNILAHPSTLTITHWLVGNVLVVCRLNRKVFKVLSTIVKYLKKGYLKYQ